MKKHQLILFFVLFSLKLFAQNNNTLLWRIYNPVTDSNSYLFGTIHLPQERFMRLPDSVYSAISRCSVFYNEINFLNMTDEMDEINAFTTYATRYMDSVKTTSAWKRLVSKINQTYHRNIRPDDMEAFGRFGQEILAEIYKPEPGVTVLDVALAGFAMSMGKTTKGLERYAWQLKMIYRLLDARIKDSTLLFNDDIRLAKDLAGYYEGKRLDSIERLITDIHPVYRTIVFDNRNKTMTDSIEAITKNRTAFFAVGAGHLTGQEGILALLKAKGLQVFPVHSGNAISATLMLELLKTGADNIQKLRAKKKEDDIVLPPPMEELNDGIKTQKKPSAKPKKQ